MKRIIHIVLKIILSLILLSPILGALSIFPPPTRELYNTDAAFAFINILAEIGYINYIIALVNLVAIFALWTKREAFGALIITPITVNIIGFHAFLDGGLLTSGAIMANVLLLLNIYFLWKNREAYKSLLKRE
jgi:hypothetical protein